MDISSSSKFVPEPRVNIFLDKKIGSGRFQVYHARLPSQQTEYAVKAFPKDKVSEASYLREKEITSSLAHENVIKYVSNIHLHGAESFNCNFLIMEYAPHGTFFELISNRGLTDEKFIRSYFRQLVEGLEYLHQNKITHGDLKLENLLLGEDFVLKIADFDQSQRAEERKTEFTGTACYRAPEVLEGNCVNFMAADVYSLGVLLYAFKAQEFPFIEKSSAVGKELIHYDLFSRRNNEFWSTKSAEKKNDSFFSQSFKDLINGMLERDSQRRFTLQDIKNSRWYNEPCVEKKDMKVKMEKVWERIMFKRSFQRGKSFSK